VTTPAPDPQLFPGTICRYCGEIGLHWKETYAGWRLFDDEDQQHHCQSERKWWDDDAEDP
jgi:hypothetical protein